MRAGLGIVYGFVLLLSTVAFWLVRLDNVLVIVQSLFGSAGPLLCRWPVAIFPGKMRPVLTFVVPIAFAVTVPAQALSSQLSLGGVLLSLGVAAFFLVGSRLLWLVALHRRVRLSGQPNRATAASIRSSVAVRARRTYARAASP